MEMMTDLEPGPQQSAEESKGQLNRWKRLCIYLGTVGMLVAFLMGLDMSWTALTAALIFVILDFKDAGPCLEKVNQQVFHKDSISSPKYIFINCNTYMQYSIE
jgi:hypothetical protein